jgi:excisionase family DNA binding protein
VQSEAQNSEQVTRLRYADLPDICTPADLQRYLPIGRDAIYAALADGTIPSKRLGQKYIIPRAALRDFLGGVE